MHTKFILNLPDFLHSFYNKPTNLLKKYKTGYYIIEISNVNLKRFNF
jgi:hypothetical protein